MASKETGFLRALIEKPLRLTGLAGAVLVWVVIYFSIRSNPWFVFTEHAFSDLGGPAAVNPGLFNYGLMLLGCLFAIYSMTLITDAINKMETAGGAFALMAGVFLALIGFYPSGTTPHTFVSTWFFIQADLAIIAWGIGTLLSGWNAFGAVFTCTGIVGPMLAFALEWPSIAVLEAYGIVIIDAWLVLMLRIHYVRLKKPKATYIRFE